MKHSIHDHISEQGKTSFCVKLYRSEIIYDVDKYTTATAKIRLADADGKLKETVIADAQLDDWLNRQIQSALSFVRSRIRFAVAPSSRMASNEILSSEEEFVIPLRFDADWREDAQSLCDTIHSYVVNYILSEWALEANPSDYEVLQLRAEQFLERIHDIACAYDYTAPFIY